MRTSGKTGAVEARLRIESLFEVRIAGVESSLVSIFLIDTDSNLDLKYFAEIIPTLLDHGAKIDAVCMSNTILQFGRYTPLHMAARFGYREAMNILMDRGASLCLKDEVGNVPLESCLIPFKPQIQDAKKALTTFAFNLH